MVVKPFGVDAYDPKTGKLLNQIRPYRQTVFWSWMLFAGAYAWWCAWNWPRQDSPPWRPFIITINFSFWILIVLEILVRISKVGTWFDPDRPLQSHLDGVLLAGSVALLWLFSRIRNRPLFRISFLILAASILLSLLSKAVDFDRSDFVWLRFERLGVQSVWAMLLMSFVARISKSPSQSASKQHSVNLESKSFQFNIIEITFLTISVGLSISLLSPFAATASWKLSLGDVPYLLLSSSLAVFCVWLSRRDLRFQTVAVIVAVLLLLVWLEATSEFLEINTVHPSIDSAQRIIRECLSASLGVLVLLAPTRNLSKALG